jgi:imidazole glycerol-phosphate synthase subunit HisH|tara:strand:+ start:1493 stop:2104 length:612 start_codon:yes stop_codon:yes gene_type:complete
MIGIIDYGIGNLSSVHNALERLSVKNEIFSDPNNISLYPKLILPGVGSFKLGMDLINKKGWGEKIKQRVKIGTPLLGICLGMQLLFTKGEEEGETEGLDLISGTVKKMNVNKNLKLPHVGWNNLIFKRSHNFFSGIVQENDFYFTHSYSCVMDNIEEVVAEFNYGNNFVACVQKKNIIGTQFHPEKSMTSGIRLLQNFSSLEI